MSFLRIYFRVLDLLAPEVRLAGLLALANIALAVAQFVEPVLFGHIIDALSGALPAGVGPAIGALAPLIGAWVAFGLFIIAASTLVAWFADRLAHRRRNLVLADFFEHVLQLPLAYHAGAHSGRQLKIMLTGTDTLWWLWVQFFREHFAAFVFIIVLLPTTLVLNWRLALPLLVLCVAFTILTVIVMRRAEAMQRAVERHYSDLAETAADALGNVAVVQSFARVELEVSALKGLVNSLLRAQMPVLSWWAVAAVLTRSATTLTLLAILLVGTYLSTALALLHRTFDPQGGVISADGMDVRALVLTGLRRNIGVVFQETLLFNRSIAENLRVGKPDATEADMRAAAARAQALDFIERNPEGFNAPIGERGRLLSGGERQRLAIARALLKDPPILILDEATSALDPVTEARVTTALDEVMRGRTTFVIAHRLATIRNATRILVFDNGRIIESGTYDELVQRGGFFAELVKAQFGAEDVRRGVPVKDRPPVET